MKLSTQDIAAANELYSKYIDLDTAARNRALEGLVSWFESRLPFMLASLDTTRRATYDKAQKVRPMATDKRTPVEERETALCMMLRRYEIAAAFQNTYKNLETLDTVQNTLETQRHLLEAARLAKLTAFSGLLKSLNDCFGVLGIKFEISDNASSNRAFDGNGTVIFSTTYADQIKEYHPIDLIQGELPTALKAASVTVGVDGKPFLDNTKAMRFLPDVLANCGSYFKSLGIGNTGTFRPAPQAAPQAAPKPAPAAPKASGTTKHPLNTYRGVKGEVFQRLLDAMGPVSMDVLYSGLQCEKATRLRLISHLTKDGTLNGKWDIVYTSAKKYSSGGGTVTLNLL